MRCSFKLVVIILGVQLFRSGGPKLRETQVYSEKFGRRVANLHLKEMAQFSECT